MQAPLVTQHECAVVLRGHCGYHYGGQPNYRALASDCAARLVLRFLLPFPSQATVPLTKGRNRIWIADASASLIASFASGITGDGAATLNPGQTRQTEGLIPKLKLVKPDDIAAESSISCRSA